VLAQARRESIELGGREIEQGVSPQVSRRFTVASPDDVRAIGLEPLGQVGGEPLRLGGRRGLDRDDEAVRVGIGKLVAVLLPRGPRARVADRRGLGARS